MRVFLLLIFILCLSACRALLRLLSQAPVMPPPAQLSPILCCIVPASFQLALILGTAVVCLLNRHC